MPNPEQNLNIENSIQPEKKVQTEDIELTPEQQAAKDDIIKHFQYVLMVGFNERDLLLAIKAKDELPEEVIMSPEIQEATEKLVRGLLSSRYYDFYNLKEKAVQIKEEFFISKDRITQIVKDEVIEFLRNMRIDDACKIADTFGNRDEIVLSPEVQQSAMETCIVLLSHETYIGYTGKTLVSVITKIRETFNVSPKACQDIFVESLDRLTARQDIVRISEIEKSFGFIVSEEEWEESVKRKMIEKLPHDITLFREMRRRLIFPEKIMLSDDVREAGKQAVFDKLLFGNKGYAAEVLRFFIPDGGNISEYSYDMGGLAMLFKEGFNVSDEEIQKNVKTAVEKAFLSNSLDSIVRIQELGLTSPELFNSREEIVNLMDIAVRNGDIQEILDEIELFNLPDHTIEIIDNLSAAGKISEGNIIKFVKHLSNKILSKKFPKTFEHVKSRILECLDTNQDLADYFVENLDHYYDLPWVAKYIEKAVSHYSVAKKFTHSKWIDESWAADVLTKTAEVIKVFEGQWPSQDGDGYFPHGGGGFSEVDPYENHPWRFGGDQILMSHSITKILSGEKIRKIVAGKEVILKGTEQTIQIPRGKSKQESREWEYEIDQGGLYSEKATTREIKVDISEELRKQLAEIGEKIEISYQGFLERIRANPNIKNEDKDALLNPERISVKMSPLIDNIRAFSARFIVQAGEGKVSNIEEIVNKLTDGPVDSDYISFQGFLEEGFNKYIKALEVDVPLYDKLYEEFDNLRETGRNPLEVYLGRDGIYAWIGRRAQDIARRRKMGLEGRKKLREMGEVAEIHPKYLVYPRYFRDNLNYETKREFLEQERISQDADPLFYDTGYTGTIPEQIMRIMDFDNEDIERRIRLLSAPTASRRVKGIPENARSEIIEYIEHNDKTEEASEGLIVDEKTGKIRRIAKPTSPEEQFYFMMVKQAIARHYWLQEQLYHEPSGNINLDSEHFAIRIRQDYAKLLPQEFIHDPKEFLIKHGELLKGSKGEGEYPDEEVTLFKLTDGTEIIAKRIELRKAKEARKEFAILISAKKAGLPTAEPVGFLSGKEDADGSYLLMKKLEGRSGRKFEKELRESGKYSDEKVKYIMKQVVEKNKEMAELFRTTLKIDKSWRIKDTIIGFNEETGEVESVIPIDWERVQNYDPENKKGIDEIV